MPYADGTLDIAINIPLFLITYLSSGALHPLLLIYIKYTQTSLILQGKTVVKICQNAIMILYNEWTKTGGFKLQTTPDQNSSCLQRIAGSIYEKVNQSKILQAIRESLVTLTPVILIGAFSLAFYSIPVESCRTFIQTAFGGMLGTLLNFLYKATFGCLSFYMVISLTVCYCSHVEADTESNYLGALFSSLLTFAIFSGVLSGQTDILSFIGVNGFFIAITGTLFSCFIYYKVQEKIPVNINFYTLGTDTIYLNMMKYLMPIFIVAALAAVLNLLLCTVFHVDNLHDAYIMVLRHIFTAAGRNYGSAFMYIFLVHLLWFFGIHGGNVLDTVSRGIFEPATGINAALIEAGMMPTEIYSKTFFDTFILMGGCGSTLCLLIAILLFAKKSSLRHLAKFSVLPSICNINELLLFGMPIVFNPLMLLPFFLVPIVSLTVSAAAMRLGLVPLVSSSVEWTTPILIGGYYATGSVAGSVLQLVNLCVGVLIYRPFIVAIEHKSETNAAYKINTLIQALQESENNHTPLEILHLPGDAGMIAQFLSTELKDLMKKGLPTIFYQPQYNHKGQCIGAEALLRWKHSVYGWIYPPLIIKLARENGSLLQLETDVFRQVLCDMERIKKAYGDNVKISVNVTGTTIQSREFESFLQVLSADHPQYTGNIMIEITEQDYLKIDTILIERLKRLKGYGYRFAIDDFSMGNTSIQYLKNDIFDMVKLDGFLVRDLLTNERCLRIVRSLTAMANELHIQLLAEYVETREQQLFLEQIGCCLYQGYLYSPAVALEEFLKQKQ